MNVLVIGGAGFIGSYVVDALVKENYHVKVISRSLTNIIDVNSNELEYVQADYGDSLIMAEALIGIDLVVHMASSTVPATASRDPVADVETNLVNSIKLFQAMKFAGVRRIIYFSSGGTVYGKPLLLPVIEDHRRMPISSYGITKQAIENHLFMHQALGELDVTILRPSNPFGPRQKKIGAQGAITTFAEQILRNKTITIWGDGSVIRDYIYITDLIDVFMLVLESSYLGVLNVGSGKGFSLMDVIGFIEKASNKKAKIKFENKRGFDVEKMILCINKANSSLNWLPKVDIEHGINLHWNWLLENQE